MSNKYNPTGKVWQRRFPDPNRIEPYKLIVRLYDDDQKKLEVIKNKLDIQKNNTAIREIINTIYNQVK